MGRGFGFVSWRFDPDRMTAVLDRRRGALAFGLGPWKTALRIELKQAGLKSRDLLDPWRPGVKPGFV